MGYSKEESDLEQHRWRYKDLFGYWLTFADEIKEIKPIFNDIRKEILSLKEMAEISVEDYKYEDDEFGIFIGEK